MIKIVNLNKVYKKDGMEVVALRDVNMTIKTGEIHGIIGLSGAGKSSLIRCINRIEEPTSGEIWINDVNIINLNQIELREIRKKIGMIFQGFNLLSSKTVFENVAFPLELAKVPKEKIRERVDYLLKLVGLEEKKYTYPSRLSGGQMQRVGIARALANNPEVLLCDEATSALDPMTTNQILRLLKDINKKFNLTMVVVTHEMDVIKEICDYVTILENGKIVEEGRTIDVFSMPKHKTAKEFIDDPKGIPDIFKGRNLLRLSFSSESAVKPIIARLCKELDVEVNIISGKIDHIGQETIGKLVVDINGEKSKLPSIISYLEKNDVIVEVVKDE